MNQEATSHNEEKEEIMTALSLVFLGSIGLLMTLKFIDAIC